MQIAYFLGLFAILIKGGGHLHPIADPSFIFTGSQSVVSTCACKSAKYILKSVGLSIQPCFTPWLVIKVGVKFSEIFMQAISLE